MRHQRRGWLTWCVAALGTGLAASSCGDFETPTGGVDAEVRVVPVIEELAADSVGAVIADVGFRVVERKGEDPPVPNVLVAFFAPAEPCGRALRPSDYTDDEGLATTDWELGTEVGECVLNAQAVSSAGGVLATSATRVQVVAGQGDAITWLNPGEARDGTGSFAASGGEYAVLDRFTHDVPWRFRVVEGPLRTAGDAFGSEGARTLIPDGAPGAAEVVMESGWGVFETLRAWVCADGATTSVRVYRPASATDPGPGC